VILFLFHTVILVLLALILGYAIASSGSYQLLGPLFGLLTLYLIHCSLWGEACTSCDLGSPTCVAEIALFWIFVAWGVLSSGLVRLKKE